MYKKAAFFLLLFAAFGAAAQRTSVLRSATDSLMPYNKNGKWGFISREAKNISFAIAPQYESAYPFRDGHAVVRKEGKWGFINVYGTFVVPAQYDDVKNGVFRNDRLPVQKGGKWNLVDAGGFSKAASCDEISYDDKAGTAVCKYLNPENPGDFDGINHLYSIDGRKLIGGDYSAIYPWFKNGVSNATYNGKRALISREGRLLTGLDYKNIYHTDIEQFICVLPDEKTHDIYDERGKLLFRTVQAWVGAPESGRVAFKDEKSKLYGYFDLKGKVAIPAQFVLANRFSKEGVAIVQRTITGPLESIDVAGNTKASVQDAFIRLDQFHDGRVWLIAESDKKVYCYDRNLQKIFPQGFRYAAPYDEQGFCKADIDDQLCGLLDKQGNWVVQPIYHYFQYSGIPGYYIVTTTDEKTGLVKTGGEVVIEPQPVNIQPWDEDFLAIYPQSLIIKTGSQLCFWRKDGVYYYDTNP